MPKLKSTHLILLVLLMTLICLGGCTKEVKPDTQHNVSWLTKLSLDEKNYSEFTSYFAEGLTGKISQDEFDKMSELTTAAWTGSSYHLIEFSNGEMLLLYLTPSKTNGKYYIQDVKVVPDELKDFFNHGD